MGLATLHKPSDCAEKIRNLKSYQQLAICAFLINQGQNVGNSFWRVTNITDGEDYLIQEAYQEMQAAASNGGNDCPTCK